MKFKSFGMVRTFGALMFMLQFSLAAEGQPVVSIKKQRITAAELIKEIKRQTGYNVLYSNQVVPVNKQIQVEFKQEVLEKVLKSMGAELGISYEIKDRTIMLVEANSTATSVKSEAVKTETKSNQQSISGTVKDGNGQALQGASVSIQGSTTATSTDNSGSFKLNNVKVGDKIVVRYVGYIAQTITVSNLNSPIHVVLVAEDNTIEDVIVTALGIKRTQKSLSYNVQQVNGDDLTQVRDANFLNAMSGKVAGATINASSGGVGGATKVVLRGTKSIAQDNGALYVIDGIPLLNVKGGEGTEFGSGGTTEGMADINPEDIESVSVMTGAAAAALYGYKGQNGAILITTKKGSAGKTTLALTQNTQFLTPFILPEFQNRYGTGSGLSDGVNDRSWGERLNDLNFMGYDPRQDYFQSGVVATEGLSFSTGNDKSQTYASIGAVNSKGIIPNNRYDKYNFTIRNTSKFLNDKLSLDIGANYILQKDQNMTNQGIYSNPIVTAYLFPRGDDWNDIKMFERYDVARKIYTQYWPQELNQVVGQNPYWMNYRNLRNNNKDRYMFNAGLTYEINDWLSLSSRGRIDNVTGTFTEKLYATTNTTITEGSLNGFYGVSDTKNGKLYGDFMANIKKDFANEWALNAHLGTIIEHTTFQALSPLRGPLLENAIPNKFVSEQVDTRKKYQSSDDSEQLQSVFASAELGYKGTYYLTATARNDWASQLFGENSIKGSFFYPSVGASIVLSEALELPSAISYLKLRGAYVEVGKPFEAYLGTNTYAWDPTTQRYTDVSHYPIKDLKPERSQTVEFGLDARFLQKFNAELSLYRSITKDQTFNPQLSVSSGFTNMYVQTGRVLNQGVEFSIGYKNQWNNFSWASNYVFGANKNEVLELVRNFVHPETGAIINKDRLEIGGVDQARFVLKEGGTLGDIYSLSDLQRDDRGNIFVSPDGNIAKDNTVGDILLGSTFPKSNMSWRNSFIYKDVNLYVLLAARFGGVVYSATQSFLDYYGVSEKSALDRDNGGVLVNGTDLINPEVYYRTNNSAQYYTYSADNIRLQEVALGYTIPKSVFKNKAELSLSLIGRNLLMIYKKAPFDPEATSTTGNYYQGMDYFMSPSTKNFGFNVRLKF